MNLSEGQKRVLAGVRLRVLADSAERARQRAPLLQLLAPQLLQDPTGGPSNMRRVFAVRVIPANLSSAGNILEASTQRKVAHPAARPFTMIAVKEGNYLNLLNALL